MSDSKPQRSEGTLFYLLVLAAVIGAFWVASHPHLCHGQTPPNVTPPALVQQPNLVISGGSCIGFSTDSGRPWKRFLVTSPSGGTTATVVCAEHGTGDDGGIYFYTLTVSAGSLASGNIIPPPPAQDLPIGSLTTAVSAAIAGVPAADVATMAASYEALAKQIDAGTIVSPMQLQVITGTQLLTNFTSTQIATFKSFTTAVGGWLDAQQCAGKLTAEQMAKYAAAYHAVAAAMKQGAGSGEQGAKSQAPSSKLQAPSPASPCANGQCPAPQASEPAGWFRRRRQ